MLKTVKKVLACIVLLIVACICIWAVAVPEPPDDVEAEEILAVVSEGEGISRAPAYDPESEAHQPVVYVNVRELSDGTTDYGIDIESSIDRENYNGTVLVVAVERLSRREHDTCRYGVLTEPCTVTRYDATWKATIYAAQSGEVIAEDTFVAFVEDDCPGVLSAHRCGSDGRGVLVADADDAIRDFVSEYSQ